MNLCEIRIPTYKRPSLLKRALDSLIAQDYSEWRAVVMDDSPKQEARAVVAALNDQRVTYRPNSYNLGSAGNIDQAFASNSLVGGTYACVLEDDNWLMPTYLSENIQSLQKHNVQLLLRNQEIWVQNEYTVTRTIRTTRGDWFKPQVYRPEEFQPYLFFFESVSNGGLFWHTSLASQLQVGGMVTDAGLQEYCRALQIKNSLVYEPKPLCCWAEMSSELSLRDPTSNRLFGRGIQAIRIHLIGQYGLEIIKRAETAALELNKTRLFELSMIDALYTKYEFSEISKFNVFKNFCKAYAKHRLIVNPLQKYIHAARLQV